MPSRLGSIIDLEQNYDFEVTQPNKVSELHAENNVNCVVHETASQNVSAKGREETDISDEDLNEEINKIFENVFGEENIDDEHSEEERIYDENEPLGN